jgi:hypothetical protein
VPAGTGDINQDDTVATEEVIRSRPAFQKLTVGLREYRIGPLRADPDLPGIPRCLMLDPCLRLSITSIGPRSHSFARKMGADGGSMFGLLALVADGLYMSTHAGAMLIAALAYTYGST